MPRTAGVSPKRLPSTIPTSKISLTAQERALKALELKKAGFSYRRIAEELGYKQPSSAHEAVQRVLKRDARVSIDQMRQMDDERTEEMFKSLYPKIKKGEPRAIEVAVRVLERRAKMWGYDEVDRPRELPRTAPVTLIYVPDARDPAAQEYMKDVVLNGRQYPQLPSANPDQILEASATDAPLDQEEDWFSGGDGIGKDVERPALGLQTDQGQAV